SIGTCASETRRLPRLGEAHASSHPYCAPRYGRPRSRSQGDSWCADTLRGSAMLGRVGSRRPWVPSVTIMHFLEFSTRGDYQNIEHRNLDTSGEDSAKTSGLKHRIQRNLSGPFP